MANLSDELRAIAHDGLNHPGVDARIIAEKGVGRFKLRDLRELAIQEVASMIDGLRRAAVLEIEKEAAIETARNWSANRGREIEEANRMRDEAMKSEYGLWLEDPSILDPARKASISGHSVRKYLSDEVIRDFRSWCGHERYGEWYERGCRLAEEWHRDHGGDRGYPNFNVDYYRYGIDAFYNKMRNQRIRNLIDEVEAETRLQVTNELLSALFALGDGRQVTWGAATVDEHRQRMEMLAKNASGIVNTAARHQAAIRMIEESGATCLADLEA